jgi:hypothetical protein
MIWRVGFNNWWLNNWTPEQRDYVERGVNLYEQERKGGK